MKVKGSSKGSIDALDKWIYRKPCPEHNEIATYCSMEKRWICPKCPMNEILKETKFLMIRKRR